MTADENKPTFTADDLAHVKGDDGDGDAGDKTAVASQDGAAGAGAETGKGTDSAKGEDDGKSTADAKPGDGKPAGKDKTIAGGGDLEAADKAAQEAADKAHKPYWPDDWREKMAEHYAAGDKKLYGKELNRLKRFTDPTAVYGMGREAEGKLTSGGLVKVPGKDAKPEEISAFHKALGVPEKAEDYLKEVKLDNGAVIGEADKPAITSLTTELHKVGTPPQTVSTMLNWYYRMQEEAAAKIDEDDDKFLREAETVLKDAYGPKYRAKKNALGTLFASAAGGSDMKNENSVMFRVMNARTPDGRIVGADPDIMRFFFGATDAAYPEHSVVEDGAQGGQSIEQELAQIDKARRENRHAYNKDYKMQARERELLEAQSRVQARNRA